MALALLLVLGSGRATAAGEDTSFIPLPDDALPSTASPNPVSELTMRGAREFNNALKFTLPEALQIDSAHAVVEYRDDSRVVTYRDATQGIRMRTSSGADIITQDVEIHLPDSTAIMHGPLTFYQGESLIMAESGSYNWETNRFTARTVRGKLQGIIIRGSDIEFVTLEDGRRVAKIRNAYLTTEDEETPMTWIGAKKLTVRLDESFSLSGLSVATADHDITVPVLGWITFSHSLNPKEGYLPIPGFKSIWGGYLLNYYGFLVGNRRVENSIPTADYVISTRADWRARRGPALGFGAEDVAMEKKYKEMTGLSLYYVQDRHPNINPTNQERTPVDHERYRFALQTHHTIDRNTAARTTTSITTNLNVLSDRYMLRDFFEDISEVDDKPDNTIRLSHVSPSAQTMLYTRLAPNDFYTTDSRLEGSYYRVRTALGKTGLAYETRNSAGILRQEIPTLQRNSYLAALDKVKDQDMRNYYARLLNDHTYARVNSTHELSTAFRVLNFLNVTPKAGFAYTGYYGVDDVGTDNRFITYLGCDFNTKFHRKYDSFAIRPLGMKGLTHIIRPYTTVSATSASSSDPLVPQIDAWSSTLSGTSINPVPLDLMSYTGIDNWGTATIWRMGLENTFKTSVDGEQRTLFSLNSFIDYNADNPNSPNSFSNFYNIARITPSDRFSYSLELQTPLLKGGDGFTQINNTISYQVTRWMEISVSHRYLSGQPVLYDSSQAVIRANIRINERYTIAAHWDWETKKKRLPIQEYAIFRHAGPWYIGATVCIRDNGGKRDTSFGICFLLGETGTEAPISF